MATPLLLVLLVVEATDVGFAILCFVGVKMLLSEWYDIPTGLSLGVVGSVLALAVAASLLVRSRESSKDVSAPPVDREPLHQTGRLVARRAITHTTTLRTSPGFRTTGCAPIPAGCSVRKAARRTPCPA